MKIDLNCDCGESFGRWTLGDDAAMLPHVSSANVACGAHAGDPLVMRRTVRLARELGVNVGAHPSYPDLPGFGRREMRLEAAEITAQVLAQIGALYGVARAEGVEIIHVKPHGALYNVAARDERVAEAIARGVAGFSRNLILVALAGSRLVEAGIAAGLTVAREAFVDRRYEADGSLRSRSFPGAVIHDIGASVEQARSIVLLGSVTAHDGSAVSLAADTLCLHGDTPGAAERAAVLRRELEAAGIEIVSLRRMLGV